VWGSFVVICEATRLSLKSFLTTVCSPRRCGDITDSATHNHQRGMSNICRPS